jgi:hypothetical protein
MPEPSTRSGITITLSAPIRRELARIARDAHQTEDEIVEKAIKYVVQAQRHPAIPRFARRLGPFFLEDDPSAA